VRLTEAGAELPPHAQDIYREAFNHAFTSYAGDVRQEEIAHRTA
jgi:cation transport regulator